MIDYKQLYQEIVLEIMERVDKLEKAAIELDKSGNTDAVMRTNARIDELVRHKQFIDDTALRFQEKIQ